MEAILGPDSEPFETFISDHMEKPSDEAELLFNMMKQKDPNSLAIKLVNLIDSSHDIDFRTECAFLLKKLLTDEDEDLCIWPNLSVFTQSTIKFMLLNRIKLEEYNVISKMLRRTIMYLGASLLPDNNWPELFPFLCQCVTDSTSDNYLNAAAFFIFRRLADKIGETVVPWLKDLHTPFLNTLNDDTLKLYVRLAAMNAVIGFISCVPSSIEKERFQDLLPGMMRTLNDAACNGEEMATQRALKIFIKLAENEPTFLRTQLVVVVGSILEIAEDEKLEDETRHLAVEFLMVLVEDREKTPGMMKRLPSFISRCFELLLNLLVLDTKDDPVWHRDETMDDNTFHLSTCHFHGKEYLERFSLALGGKSIAHIATEQLPAYLDAPEWEKRHAALLALVYIAEGCSKVMIKNLEQVVNMVLNCFRDSHPRVRWAACRAIAKLSAEFRPDLQEQYHDQVLPALAAAMDDFHPRVQAFCIRALCWFCMTNKPEILIAHLDGIVGKLLVLLQSDKKMVQQEALGALSCIAESVMEHFRIYYDTVMPHLRIVMRNTDLRALAMECIGFVGVAVGKEKFRDGKQVMEVLMSLQGLLVKVDDLTTYHMLSACTRICQCMGQDFLPYMSTVMSLLIKCAHSEPVMTITTEQDYENYELGDNSIDNQDIRAAEKARACNLIYEYANTLKEDFYPWISQAVPVVVPFLKFYTGNPVRICAVNAIYKLLCSAKLAVEKGIAEGGSESYFKELSDYIILTLIEALHKEYMAKICTIMLGCLDYCIKICGPLLNEGQVRSIINEIKHVITESSSRQKEATETAKTEDFDAEEAELLREGKEQEEEIHLYVGYILCTLIRTFKDAVLPSLDDLSSYLIPMWDKEKTINERCISIRIFNDLVKECPEAALKYYGACLPLILDASNDEDPYVREAALYGLKLWAEYGSSSFKPFVGEALSRINVVMMHLKALEPENECAYDNATSTLGMICQLHGESIDLAQVIPAWLNCLPIKADLVEAKLVHEQLCSMVERSDRELLGTDYQYLPKVVSVFAEVLCSEKDLVTEETANRMINVLRHLQQILPLATLELAWSYLLPQQEMELRSILSPEE